MSGAGTIRSDRTSARGDARVLVWWAALGLAAGAVSGAVIGGIGGRVAMLILRRESPIAVGLTSDAGFEIGRVTLGGSLSLIAVTALLGAAGGLAYVAVRAALPSHSRIPAAALVGATAGGSAFIDPEGFDLLVLGPTWFAVTAFIALPAMAAAATAAIVERRARGARAPDGIAWGGTPDWLGLAVRVGICLLILSYVVVQGAELIGDVTVIP